MSVRIVLKLFIALCSVMEVLTALCHGGENVITPSKNLLSASGGMEGHVVLLEVIPTATVCSHRTVGVYRDLPTLARLFPSFIT